jgi:hypothetical protein
MKPLSIEERFLLADLLRRDACEKAAVEEANEQARRRREIDAKRQVIDLSIQARALEDQQPYVPGQKRGGRRTVALGPSQSPPVKLQAPRVIPTPVKAPTMGFFDRCRLWLKNWVIRKFVADHSSREGRIS